MTSDETTRSAARRTRLCPICSKPADKRFRPFCSKRCADIDLGRWVSEAYRIPAESEPNGTGEADDAVGDS